MSFYCRVVQFLKIFCLLIFGSFYGIFPVIEGEGGYNGKDSIFFNYEKRADPFLGGTCKFLSCHSIVYNTAMCDILPCGNRCPPMVCIFSADYYCDPFLGCQTKIVLLYLMLPLFRHCA